MATSSFSDRGHDIWYQSSSDPRDLNKRVMESNSNYQRTIIVTVHNARYPITEDVLHQVFDPYGNIEMIRILPQTKDFEALLRFQYHNSVKSAKSSLHGRNIYDGCCRLDLQFLAVSFWDCELSKEGVAESIYSDIYELMKEMSSTIDNLISQLEKYKNSAAEKETKTVEPQVFDQLPMKKIVEMSAEKIDSHEFDSSLMTEKQTDVEKLAHMVKEEASKEPFQEEASKESVQLLDNGYANYRLSMRTVQQYYHEETKRTIIRLVDIGSGRNKHGGKKFRRQATMKMDMSGKFNLKNAGKSSVYVDGIGKFHIQKKSSIQILFDPGGYVVKTWKMTMPLNFRSVTVGISRLSLNSLEDLMVSWIHMVDILIFGENSTRINVFEIKKSLGKGYDGSQVFVWIGVGVYEVFYLQVFHTSWKYLCASHFIIFDYEVRCVNRKMLLETREAILPKSNIRYSSRKIHNESDGSIKCIHLANGIILKSSVVIRYDGIDPEDSFFSIRRFIGRKMSKVDQESKQVSYNNIMWDDNGYVKLECPAIETQFATEEISAQALKELVNDASKFLNNKITEAIITIPAYYNDSQRTATKGICLISGLEVLHIINEPTVASLAYGFEKKSNETILVFYLEGSTFDVSVLVVGDGVFEVLSTFEDTHLGGDCRGWK